MKKSLILLLLTLFTLSSFSQEYIFKFKVNSKEEFNNMNRLVSIDHGYGVGEVVAYANAEQFEYFKTLGYDYEMMPHPSKGKSLTMAVTVAEMANWDRYPTHEVYLEMMQQLATNYPDICRVETIGTSEDGRAVKVFKITDNPDANENEPEFFYTGQMHGDEIVDYILFLRLAYYLTDNYNKKQGITDLINNVEIWINPLSNPDGTYNGGNNTVSSATRSNSHGVDLNRSFPSPNLPNPPGQNETEVQMMITFAENHNLNMSANSHSGAECVNFPWDTWSSSHPHADHDWWSQVSHNYANTVHENSSGYMTGFDNGVTHGGDWYVVHGSRQDHMGYYQYCREVTLELSNTKMLDCELLPAHFTYNRDAMIGYIEEVFYGIRGIVTDENENPLEAVISISGHDADNSEVLSDPATGNYHRMIDNGTYNLTFTVSGYSPITVNNISVTDEEITIIDVMFDGSPGVTTLSGTIINQETSNPIENAEIIITGQDDTYTVYTNANGEYSVNNVTVGTYKFEMSATSYMSAIHYETVSTADSDVSKSLNPTLYITGTVIEAQTGNIIEGAEIEIQNSSLNSVTTNSNGVYYISVMSGTYSVKASYTGLASSVKEITVSENNNELNFQLLPSTSLSFEDGIPEGFTYSGDADWTRVSDEAYDDDYSMKSANITHDQNTVMQYTANTEAGEFSYFMNIDTESGYDYLRFYIDELEKEELSGNINWTEYSYNISAGSHTFKWDYKKDGSVSSDNDCAWVDYITLPTEAPDTYILTFYVHDDDVNIENASVTLTGYGTKLTNIDGETIFTDIYGTSAPGLSYTVSAAGYDYYSSTIEVDDNHTIDIDMNTSDTGHILSNTINVYPNPNFGNFTIEFDEKIERILITDITGKIIKDKKSSCYKINISDMRKGMYLISLYTDKSIFYKKVIVN